MILYNDTMGADRQVTAEENIASHLIEYLDDAGERKFTEDEAATAGRNILKQVLIEFRNDLFVPSHWVCPKCHSTKSLDHTAASGGTTCLACIGPGPPPGGQLLCLAEMVLTPKEL